MNKNLKIKQFGRSKSKETKIKKIASISIRSKTPDKNVVNLLKMKNIRESIENVRSQSIFTPFKVFPEPENKSIIFFAFYGFLEKYLELSKGVYPKLFNFKVMSLF